MIRDREGRVTETSTVGLAKRHFTPWALAVATIGLGVAFGTAALAVAQNINSSGAIAGSVSTDRGEVRGLRVQARDTVRRIVYTVYTSKGRYEIANLPPSSYEVRVLEETFDSPVQTIEVRPGATTTANVAVKAKAAWQEGMPALGFAAINRLKDPQLAFTDFDTLYPPNPARDLMMKNGCFNCHAGGAYYRQTFHLMGPRTEAQWRRGVESMFNLRQGRVGRNADGGYEVGVPNPVQSHDRVSEAETDIIVQYLTRHFGPTYKRRDLRLDPLVRDEEALAKATYIQYELKRVIHPPYANGGGGAPSGHTAHASKETPGVWWITGLTNSSILRVDTRDPNFETRTKEWLATHPANVSTNSHGIVEVGGKVWWVEMSGNRLGEFDPKTEQMQAYFIPTQGGSPHDPWPDSKGNLWYTMWSTTGKVGRFNMKTKEFKEYEVSKGWAGYGLIVDKQDRVWVVGLNTPAILMHDPKTDKFTSYPLSLPARRPILDSRGRVWVCHYYGNMISMLDPATGKVNEYRLPLKYGNVYALWADADGMIWLENSTYNSMVRFNPRTEQFTYFPFPDLNAHTYNMNTDPQGTLGFTLGSPMKLTMLKPRGNVSVSSSSR